MGYLIELETDELRNLPPTLSTPSSSRKALREYSLLRDGNKTPLCINSNSSLYTCPCKARIITCSAFSLSATVVRPFNLFLLVYLRMRAVALIAPDQVDNLHKRSTMLLCSVVSVFRTRELLTSGSPTTSPGM